MEDDARDGLGAIDPDLWQAFAETVFEADLAEDKDPIRIRIGQTHARLDELLRDHQAVRWAFITAWNPSSLPLPSDENSERNERLREQLLAGVYPMFGGRGIGAHPGWEPEESFLVLGISSEDAMRLGKRFGQLAIVVGEISGEAQLVEC